MNILMLLVPKAKVDYLYADYSVRQALEKMSAHRYSLIPVIDRETGEYIRSISEGDLLYYLKDEKLPFHELEERPLSEVKYSREIKPVEAFAEIASLQEKILAQNYVPVIDNRGVFIGIVTRKAVIEWLLKEKPGE